MTSVFRFVAVFGMLAIPVSAVIQFGKVIDSRSGDPVGSALVTFAGCASKTVETDAQGQFQYEARALATCEITVSSDNYLVTRVRDYPERFPSPMTIRMVPLGVISGTAVYASGKPVLPGVASLFSKDEAGIVREFGTPVHINASGEYRIYAVPPGEYAVALRYGEAAQGPVSMPFRSASGSGAAVFPDLRNPRWFVFTGGDDQRADFIIDPLKTYSISGRVKGDFELIQLSVSTADPFYLLRAVRTVVRRGEFLLDDVRPGAYEIVAVGRGQSGRATVEVSGTDIEGVEVTLRPGRSVRFNLDIAPETYTPICPSQATLTLIPLLGKELLPKLAMALKPGVSQTLNDVSFLDYRATLSGLSDQCYVAVSPSVSPSDDSKTILVTAGATIAGRVTGSAASEKPVILLTPRHSAGEPAWMAFPSDDFGFSFSRLRPGAYQLAVYSGKDLSGTSVRTVEVVAEAGKVKEIELLGR